jgi:hypothetical protein
MSGSPADPVSVAHSAHLVRWRRVDLLVAVPLLAVLIVVIVLLSSDNDQWKPVSLPHGFVGAVEQLACSHRAVCLVASTNGQMYVSHDLTGGWGAIDLKSSVDNITYGADCLDWWCMVATSAPITGATVLATSVVRQGDAFVRWVGSAGTSRQVAVGSATCTSTGSLCMLLTPGSGDPSYGGRSDSATTTVWTTARRSTSEVRGVFTPIADVPSRRGHPNPIQPACATSRVCIAVGYSYNPARPWVTFTAGATWVVPTWTRSIGSATSVACGAANSCAIGTDGGSVIFVNPSGAVVRRSHLPCASCQVGTVTSVSCWSGRGCVAAGDGPSGSLFFETTNEGRTWEAMSGPDNFGITVVSCASADRCLAVGFTLPGSGFQGAMLQLGN